MSANNRLIITKYKGKYRIKEIDADTGKVYRNDFNDIEFVEIEDALKVANKYQMENEVEYGLQVRI